MRDVEGAVPYGCNRHYSNVTYAGCPGICKTENNSQIKIENTNNINIYKRYYSGDLKRILNQHEIELKSDFEKGTEATYKDQDDVEHNIDFRLVPPTKIKDDLTQHSIRNLSNQMNIKSVEHYFFSPLGDLVQFIDFPIDFHELYGHGDPYLSGGNHFNYKVIAIILLAIVIIVMIVCLIRNRFIYTEAIRRKINLYPFKI